MKNESINIINFDNVAEENKTTDNPKWTYIPHRPYRILINESSALVKTNSLHNITSHQADFYKISTFNLKIQKGRFKAFQWS